MARRKPEQEAAFIAWSRARVNQWLGGQAGPPNIGLTIDQINQADALVTDLETKHASMIAKRDAAETATGVKDTAYAETDSYMAGMIDIIDGFAKSTKDPGVYALAGIAEPKKPSARTEAPTPADIATRITSNGDVVFTFKVAAGGSATFPVQRKTISLDGYTGPWEDLGLANSDKKYTDRTANSGVSAYIYRVATRLTTGVQSEWSEWATASFGVDPGVVARAVEAARADEGPSAQAS
ncbi:MAG: hypothetical protein RIE32_13120 [Phycisphaerales bacterium]